MYRNIFIAHKVCLHPFGIFFETVERHEKENIYINFALGKKNFISRFNLDNLKETILSDHPFTFQPLKTLNCENFFLLFFTFN